MFSSLTRNTRVLVQTSTLIALIIVLVVAAAGQNSDSDRDAELLKVPDAKLPDEAKKAGVGGRVGVLVSVDEKGNVTSVLNVAGPDWVCPDVKTPAVTALREAASTSALKAVFKPAIRDGKPAAPEMRLNFDFENSAPPPDSPKTVGVREVSEEAKDQRSSTRGGHPDGRAAASSGDDVEGLIRAVSVPRPAYPPAARAVRASGSVSVKLIIDTDGSIYSAEAVSGHPLLRDSSRIAACRAKFEPTLLDGEPVRVSGVISYNYVP